jgi:hypothetical protein
MQRSRVPWLFLCAYGVVCANGQSVKTESELDRAVQEFKIQTASLGARADSPQTGKTRTSAGQPWHGRLFENFRNDFLDAIPHQIRQGGTDKSILRRNQFGFNVTGPVVIPHLLKARAGTYFSVSYEAVRERISRSSLRTVPTMPERLGDFSGTVDQAGNLLPIFDPNTTRANPEFQSNAAVSRENPSYLRDPFPGNRLPVSRLDATALHALALYPAPNTNIGPFFQNNLFINSPETNNANGFIGRVDHAVNDRHRLSTDFNYSDGLLGASQWFNTAANPGPPNTLSSTRRGSIEYVYTESAQVINTAGIDLSAEKYDTSMKDQPFPVYRYEEFLGMGRGSPRTINTRNLYTLTDGLSIRKGKHSMRVIGQVIRQQVNSLWGRYPAGYFRFSTGLTSLPGVVNTGHSFASFLLGMPDYAERSITTSPSYFRRGSQSVTLRDSYELRKNLTVAVAAVVIRRTPRVEKYDRQSTIDLSMINPANGRPGALSPAGRGKASRGFWSPVTRIDPSASLAWSPERLPKTVVRASYSRAHTAIPIYFGQWGTQGFNGYQSFISPNVQLEPALLLSTGFPAPPALPDLRPDAANDTVADLIDESGRDPVYQSAALSIERELPGSTVVTLGFGYAGGRQLLVGSAAANPNAIPIDALKYRDQLNDEAFNRSLRPYPQYKGFELYSSYPYGRYQRDAGYIRVEKRVSKGLSLSAYFERSKQLDDYTGPYGAQDYFNSRNEWSLTTYNRPQYIQFSYVYELPLGASKPLFNYDNWRRFLVNGWSVSGSGLYAAGLPLALRPSFNNTGGVITGLHVNAVPGVNAAVANPQPEMWFNPAALDQPPDFTIGDVSRTHPSLRGPSKQNFDLSLNKRVTIDADRVLELSAAAFNFITHADWNEPDTVIGPASAPNINAGKIIGSQGGRVIQLGLRFSF